MKEETVYCKLLDREVLKSKRCPNMKCVTCMESKEHAIISPIIQPIKKRKISYYDRMQATLRHPDFIKEYEEIKQNEKEIENISRKFSAHKKVSSIINMQNQMMLSIKWKIHIYYIKNRNKIKPGILNCISVVKRINKIPFSISLNSSNDITTYNPRLEGERLYLEVDIRESKKDLKNAFELTINQYKELYKKNFPEKAKRKKISLRKEKKIWEIYDLHNYENLCIDEIAKKINLSYNDVYNACNKASEIVWQVGDELKLCSDPEST